KYQGLRASDGTRDVRYHQQTTERKSQCLKHQGKNLQQRKRTGRNLQPWRSRRRDSSTSNRDDLVRFFPKRPHAMASQSSRRSFQDGRKQFASTAETSKER